MNSEPRPASTDELAFLRTRETMMQQMLNVPFNNGPTQPLTLDEILDSHDEEHFWDTIAPAELWPKFQAERPFEDRLAALKEAGADAETIREVSNLRCDYGTQTGEHMFRVDLIIGALMQWRHSMGQDVALSDNEWRAAITEATGSIRTGGEL